MYRKTDTQIYQEDKGALLKCLKYVCFKAIYVNET